MQAAAQAGDTRPPGLDEVVALHFVALVQREGRLLELDGRKPFPIDHGSSSPATLLQVCSQLPTLGHPRKAWLHAFPVGGVCTELDIAVDQEWYRCTA